MTRGLGSFVSQLGPDGLGHDRCAPACLASYLLDMGWESDPWLLLQELAASDAPLATDRPHGAADLLAAAHAKGFDGQLWNSWECSQAALAEPQYGVFALVENALLRPTAYPDAPGWHATHWIRLLQLVGDAGDSVVVFDPLTYLPQPHGGPYQGPVLYTVASVRAAIQANPTDYAGALVWPPHLAAPAACEGQG